VLYCCIKGNEERCAVLQDLRIRQQRMVLEAANHKGKSSKKENVDKSIKSRDSEQDHFVTEREQG
jgi:hypothetical protein